MTSISTKLGLLGSALETYAGAGPHRSLGDCPHRSHSLCLIHLQVLMTRAMRERLAQQRQGPGATRATATTSTIRIRLPNGLLLQVLPAPVCFLLALTS